MESQSQSQTQSQSQMEAPEDLSSVWDLSYLLEFEDDLPQLPPLSNPNPNPNPQEEEASPYDNIRKRDPRLICSNFLAGQVPCACPELDALLEDNGLPEKKRARTSRASSSSARCQVPGCEVDISALKGYHRRHRVCLRCANSATVLFDGQAKRYCQQCGK